jgi:hypothetical protein
MTDSTNRRTSPYREIGERSKRKIAYAIVFIIVLTTGIFVTTTPRARDNFFQFYVLGNSGLAGNYFPADSNGSISAGVRDNWTLDVINKFATVQLVEILVKLGNTTSSPPISNQSTPANLPVVASFLGALEPNQSWQIPFQWNVSNVKTSPPNYYYLTLRINNETYPTSIPATSGEDFRFIFELWSASSPSTNSLHFGWVGQEGDTPQPEAAWLQMYFNVTSIK